MKKLLFILFFLFATSSVFAVNYYNVIVINDTDLYINHSGDRFLFDNGGDFEIPGVYNPHSTYFYRMKDSWFFGEIDRDNRDDKASSRIWVDIDFPLPNNAIRKSQILVVNPMVGNNILGIGHYFVKTDPYSSTDSDAYTGVYSFPFSEEKNITLVISNAPNGHYNVTVSAGSWIEPHPYRPDTAGLQDIHSDGYRRVFDTEELHGI